MSEKLSESKVEIVSQMRQAYIEQNQELFQSFFTDDVLYKPGAIANVKGPQALWQYLQELYSPVIIDKMDSRATWEVEDAVIYDYDMQLTYKSDNRTVGFPCVDIFQFRGEKISEWRVYPLHPSFIAIKL